MKNERMVYADADAAVTRLKRNKIDVDDVGKYIFVPEGRVGLRLWGAIDYLKHYHKYRTGSKPVQRRGK